MNVFYHIGQYFLLLVRVFKKPEKNSIYIRQLVLEIEKLGINSIGIVAVISVFMGGIITLQFTYNMVNPLMPTYIIGLGNRDTLILEFSSTVLSLMLAGKVGSNIASELGSMRITEQIDSMEIMGVNSASYLILPKIIAVVFISPSVYNQRILWPGRGINYRPPFRSGHNRNLRDRNYNSVCPVLCLVFNNQNLCIRVLNRFCPCLYGLFRAGRSP